MQPSYAEFEKALKALDEALREPKNSIVRDASIQRFEFCVELAWKTSCVGGTKHIFAFFAKYQI